MSTNRFISVGYEYETDDLLRAKITYTQLAADDAEITLDLNPLMRFIYGHFREPCILDNERENPPQIRRIIESSGIDEDIRVNEAAVRLAHRLNATGDQGSQPGVSHLIREIAGPNGTYKDLERLIRQVENPGPDYEILGGVFHLSHLFEAAYFPKTPTTIGQDPFAYLERRYPGLARDAVSIEVKRHHYDGCVNTDTNDWYAIACEGSLHITPDACFPCGQFDRTNECGIAIVLTVNAATNDSDTTFTNAVDTMAKSLASSYETQLVKE